MARVIHFELPADDTDLAVKFYESAFGWQAQRMGEEYGHYILWKTGEGEGIDGGMMKRQSPDHQVSFTLDVEDLDAAIAKVEAAGGTIVMPRMAVPGVGYLAYFADTEGSVVGMMQADQAAA